MVLYGFPTFHVKQGPSRTAPYFQCEMTSITLYGSTWVYNFTHKASLSPIFSCFQRNEVYYRTVPYRFSIFNLSLIISLVFLKVKTSTVHIKSRESREWPSHEKLEIHVKRAIIDFVSLKIIKLI